MQVEDGFRLRPNLSIRGVATERSGRITLLEDGVLIAPAPYSAPSAYYFPTAGRMAAFEVLKGPAAISQGPYTIGGAFNMISTPIPVEPGGSLFAETGQHGTSRLHGTYGAAGAHGFGYLLEMHQWFSDGYQSIDRSDNDTGLDVRDYTVKLAFAPEQSAHRVELKIQLAEQTSNQSYLGLTDADFRNDPQRRYGLSALDSIQTDHEQVIVRHEYAPTDAWKLTTTVYDNRHARNWFKTEGIDFDGSVNAETLSRTSWASVVSAVNRGTALGDFPASDLAAILHGTADTAPGSIQLRANDRQYESRGVQFGVSWRGLLGNALHALRIGVRYHEDREDRLQRNSSYRQESGMLHLDDRGRLGNAGNRIQEAEAVAVFVQDRIDVGDWTLTPGLRYEAIDQRRTRYEIRPGRTENPASRAADNLRSTRQPNPDRAIGTRCPLQAQRSRDVARGRAQGVHGTVQRAGRPTGGSPELRTRRSLPHPGCAVRSRCFPVRLRQPPRGVHLLLRCRLRGGRCLQRRRGHRAWTRTVDRHGLGADRRLRCAV